MYGYEIFHETILESLISSVHSGNCSHAYIFEGDEGLRLTEAARLFAAALTCENTEIAPCGACPSCLEAKAGTNPDIIYVRPDKDKKSVSADNMRQLEQDAAIKPFSSQRKVYIFDDGAQLNEAAQNVFLKTLEEPPGYAAFIIVISNSDLLLQTIRSRSVLIHFPPVSDDAVRSYIRKKYPSETEKLDFLVKYCAGIPTSADSVIADTEFDALRGGALRVLPELFSENKLGMFDIQIYITDNKDNFTKIIDFWLSFLRDILLMQNGAFDNIINVDKQDELRSVTSSADPKKVVRVMDKLVTCSKMSARYVNVKAIAFWLLFE